MYRWKGIWKPIQTDDRSFAVQKAIKAVGLTLKQGIRAIANNELMVVRSDLMGGLSTESTKDTSSYYTKLNDIMSEDLRKWFGKGKTGSKTGGGWDRYNTAGEKIGKCGDSEDGEPYAACLSQEKAKKLGKDGIASFVKRKRAAQKKAGDAKKGGEEKKGQKPVFVKTGA
jgi:hypothetical protein